MKTAIVLGATGLTGNDLVRKLLNHTEIEKVRIFGRRSTGLIDKKIEEYLIDLFELERYEDSFRGDAVFCCIGTTRQKTPDKNIYRKIDYGIPLSCAKLAKKNKIQKLLIISSMGADSRSHVFYNRIKGEMERDVLSEEVPETYFFEPSLITGERKEPRPVEKMAGRIFEFANKILRGRFRKYRSISSETIAEAMFRVSETGYSKSRVPSDQIRIIAGKGYDLENV